MENTIEPCAVRIAPGASECDPDYFVELNTLTGGRPTFGFVRIEDGRALVQAFDTEAMPVDPELSAAEHLQIAN